MGVATLMWAIWGTLNDMVFETKSSPFLCRLFSGELIGCWTFVSILVISFEAEFIVRTGLCAIAEAGDNSII